MAQHRVIALNQETAQLREVQLLWDDLTGEMLLFAGPQNPLGVATKQYVDDRSAAQVDAAGDSMTGFLSLHADPVELLHAATKRYVDDRDAEQVTRAGDTMTGPLVLPGAPTLDLHAATKRYVDDLAATRLPLEGGTMTGMLTLFDAPSVNMHAANKQYVDERDAEQVSIAGDTMTGLLLLSGDPVAALGAATKQYVDARADEQVAAAGDTMTGPLVLSGDPAEPLQAAPRRWVEAYASDTYLPLAGGTVTGPVTINGALTVQGADLDVQDVRTTGYLDVGTVVTAKGGSVRVQAASAASDYAAFLLRDSDGVDISSLFTDGDGLGVTLRLASSGTDLSIQGDDVLMRSAAATPTGADSLINRGRGDARYLQLAGGTMAGPIVLPGDPTLATQAARKAYVDSRADEKVAKAGDTMTGPLVLPGLPTADDQATTKAYVDGQRNSRMRWRGAWAAGSYWTNDVVQDGEFLFVATAPTSEKPDNGNNPPDPADWDLLVSGGGSAVTVQDTPPDQPLEGDLWFSTAEPVGLFVWFEDADSGQWVAVAQGSGHARVFIGDLPPESPGEGELWFRTAVPVGLYVRYSDEDSTQWVAATPVPDTGQFVQKSGSMMMGSLSFLGGTGLRGEIDEYNSVHFDEPGVFYVGHDSNTTQQLRGPWVATGPVSLPSDPSDALQAATKSYVDGAQKVLQTFYQWNGVDFSRVTSGTGYNVGIMSDAFTFDASRPDTRLRGVLLFDFYVQQRDTGSNYCRMAVGSCYYNGTDYIGGSTAVHGVVAAGGGMSLYYGMAAIPIDYGPAYQRSDVALRWTIRVWGGPQPTGDTLLQGLSTYAILQEVTA